MKSLKKSIMAVIAIFLLVVSVVTVGCNDKPQEGIKIYTNFKSTYIIGDELDLTDGKIEYTDENGKKTIVAITSDMITSFSTDSLGQREMIVTYNGNTITYQYNVIYDISAGDLYYTDDSELCNGKDGYYFYIYFVSKTKIDVSIANVTPENILGKLPTSDQISVTRSIVGNEVVYLWMSTQENMIGEMKITIIDENTLNVCMRNGSASVTGNLTKYTI